MRTFVCKQKAKFRLLVEAISSSQPSSVLEATSQMPGAPFIAHFAMSGIPRPFDKLLKNEGSYQGIASAIP
jgi:hypothetical protein